MTPASDASAAANVAGSQAPAPAAEPSAAERAKALVDGYSHALATNSPRTETELAEMKALLGVD